MKRTHDDIDTTTTPKKSNVTIPSNQTSVPMTSLSHNQLVELHKEERKQTKHDSTDNPTVRQTVLSLTIALTSNASAYDSSFLRDCNAEDNAKGSNDDEDTAREAGQKWMPRLLQGTQIKLQK